MVDNNEDEGTAWSNVSSLLENITDSYTRFEGILEKTYIDILQQHETQG